GVTLLFLMIIASWNIRGFNGPLEQDEVVNLIRRNNIDVLGLLETKIDTRRLSLFMDRRLPGWAFCENFDVVDRGRIAILWNPMKVDITMEAALPQVIFANIRCKVSNHSFIASFIYGLDTREDRKLLWDDLRVFRGRILLPWLLLGDFNAILKPEERIKGERVINRDTMDLLEVCDDLGLSDISSSSFFHTWTENHVWSKLDRAMVDTQWENADFFSHATFLALGISDHSPCIVTIFEARTTTGSPWWFFNMWTAHEKFLPCVQNTWNHGGGGSRQFRLANNLKYLKNSLKALNEEAFSHISSRAKEAKNALKNAQQKLHDQPDDPDTKAKMPLLRLEALKLAKSERQFYQQKAKCNFQIKGDKCTKFYHGLVKKRTKRNFIVSINWEDGTVTDSMEEVAKEFVCYYEALLGTGVETENVDPQILRLGPCVGVDDCSALITPVTVEEIKNTLSDIEGDKSPGPDGYTSTFFLKSWSIVGGDVVAAIQAFFRSSSLLKQWNHTALTLVSKSSHSSQVTDFRPIA
ncbi:Unknown protein, partial [Striga hermonthica]